MLSTFVQDFDMVEWALNSATLAQFFMEQNAFRQARHHLSAASHVLDRHEQEIKTMDCSEDELGAKLVKLSSDKCSYREKLC